MDDWKKLLKIHKNQIIFNNSDEILLEIINTVSLKKALIDLTNDERSLLKVSDKSIHHDNGFYKIVLFSGDHFCLRLHYWTGIKDTYSNIHSHRWNLSTIILFGRYSHKVYTRGVINKLNFYSYDYLPNNNGYSLNYRCKSQLCLVSNRIYPEGSTIKIGNEILHQVSTWKGVPVATLVVTEAPVKKGTNVLAEKKIPINSNLTDKSISVEELKNILIKIIKILPHFMEENVKKHSY